MTQGKLNKLNNINSDPFQKSTNGEQNIRHQNKIYR